MGRFRYAVLERDHAEATATDEGTITIDLPEEDILSELTIQARALGAYSDDMILPMYALIKKFEVLVDGSTVVKSLSGQEARALVHYNNGPFSLTNDYAGEDNTNVRYHSFPLYFGRHAGDTRSGLNMSDYANPQLKITWNAAQTTMDGISVDAHTDPTFTYSVIAKMMEGTPSGWTNQYCQSREIDAWTTSTSAQHNTEIPRGYDLKGLMWRGAYTGINPEYTLESMLLDFDNGKWKPLDMNYAQLWEVFKAWFPKPAEIHQWIRGAQGDTFDMMLLKVAGMAANGAGNTVADVTMTTGRRSMAPMSWFDYDAGTETVVSSAWFNAWGFGPHQTIYIPMDQLVDGDKDTVPTTGYGRIDLKCTAGASSGTSGQQYVVAEYMKPNGQ